MTSALIALAITVLSIIRVINAAIILGFTYLHMQTNKLIRDLMVKYFIRQHEHRLARFKA